MSTSSAPATPPISGEHAVIRQAPTSLPSYLALARATLARAVTDGRVLPIRALAIKQVLDQHQARIQEHTS